ncbi:MAG: cytochrome d ubiquinol oxidase subunit II [Flavobacteriales bacterium]|nr:cytochrome d ubiquinol oxidase subunit II [Flavobacteriales bacterium]
MSWIVLAFLGVATFLYAILGGADYGVGVLELLSGKASREKTKAHAYRVIGPVWEANHVWLIIVAVILWVAFPVYFNAVMIYLHFPITLILLGIIGRGVAFVFRHYDAVKDGSQQFYDRLFRWSSIWTPFFLGATFGALVSGEMITLDSQPDATFYAMYIAPWTSVFSLATGAFFTGLCGFNAAVFLIGETSDDQQLRYRIKARSFNLIIVFSGLVVLVVSLLNEVTFILNMLTSPASLAAIFLATLLLYPLWQQLGKGHQVRVRFMVVIQMFLIMTAPVLANFPELVTLDGEAVSILDGIAPDAVIQTLGWALLVGSVLILPGLYHLLKSFGMIKSLEKDAL